MMGLVKYIDCAILQMGYAEGMVCEMRTEVRAPIFCFSSEVVRGGSVVFRRERQERLLVLRQELRAALLQV